MIKKNSLRNLYVAFIFASHCLIQLGHAAPIAIPNPSSPTTDIFLPAIDLLFEHTVLNGGGQGEQNLTYGLINFERFASLCAALPTCIGADGGMLQDLLSHLNEIKGLPDFIAFRVPAEAPALIDSQGRELAFATSAIWGQTIIINRNALYIENAAGQVQPISVAQSLKILTEALLFQRSFGSPEDQSGLAERLAKQAMGVPEEVVIGHGPVPISSNQMISFSTWKFLRPALDGYVSEVTIQDADATHVITPKIAETLLCPAGSNHDASQMLVRGLAIGSENGSLSVEVTAEVVYTCVPTAGNSPAFREVSQISIQADFSLMTGTTQSYILDNFAVINI